MHIFPIKFARKKGEMWTMISQFMKWSWFNKCIADCDWVKIIYKKMGGDVSMIPQNCCRMNGVKCYDGLVIGINWSNKNLNGTISPDIGNLENLNRL
jgi:hypothetical protein